MELSQNEFKLLRDYIHKICGIDVSEDKHYLIQQRLEPVVKLFNLGNFAGLIGKLGANGGDMHLRDNVIEAITTNETFFFRDDHPFDTFSNFLLPALSQLAVDRKSSSNGRKGSKVSIWCAASSTGQEPYSLAILINEYAAANSYKGINCDDFSILATDISATVLAKAISGVYTELEISRGMGAPRREKYFTKEGHSWILKNDVQRMVDFRKVNLSESFTMLGGFDMIFCRNVLIYFDDEAKKRIFSQFHSMLTDGGYLMLGACENLNMLSDGFESERYNETILYKVKK